MTDSNPPRPSRSTAARFLPEVPEDLCRAALARAGGNEIASGKFASAESSAALAVNAFGWFLDKSRAPLLPPFPGLGDLDWPAETVEVEREMRFPWSGGRHPWLDAAVETREHLVGIESKRFEPFRSPKMAHLAEAYDRDCWGEGMTPWCAMRDALRTSPSRFRHLDAAQLVKHALGLVTQGRRIGKAPVLVYLYAEPRRVPVEAVAAHRDEAAAFAAEVAGAVVRFAALSWNEWLDSWQGPTSDHGQRVRLAFAP
jgi:hypothetical protein